MGKIIKDGIEYAGSPTNFDLALGRKGDSVVYDSQTSKLQLKSGNTVLSETTIQGGGGSSTKSVVNITNSTLDMAGETVTVTIGGGETVTAVFNNNCETTVLLSYIGTYQITCGTAQSSVTVSELGGTYSADIISSTWKKWAMVGDAYKSTYTSLSDVLADEKAIRKLMTKHSSVDWLAETCTDMTLIETIINDDYCAKWINLRDYALDTLYANEDIAALMDTADKYFYGEWALMPQVPTMTSNTAPYGELLQGNTTTDPYKAFDGNINTQAHGSETAEHSVGYKFTSPIICKRFSVAVASSNTMVKLQGSNDGFVSDIHDLTNYSDVLALSTLYSFDVNNDTPYTSYRVYEKSTATSSGYIAEVQFYAWQPKGNVPVMTSKTAPYGEISVSSEYMSANSAFIQSPSSAWIPTAGSTDNWLCYKFVNPVDVRKVKMTVMMTGTTAISAKTFIIQGSNDNSSWDTLCTLKTTQQTSSSLPTWLILKGTVSNSQYYLYYRVFCPDAMYGTSPNWDVGVAELQFYGRELKVSVPTMTSNTEPYGEASASSFYSDDFKAFKALDGDSSTFWATDERYTVYNAYNSYKFPNPTLLKKACIRMENGAIRSINYKFQGSNDNLNWTDISATFNEVVEYKVHDILAGTSYLFVRLLIVSQVAIGDAHACGRIYDLQFYGLDYSEYDWDQDSPRKYIYDHGVELEENIVYYHNTGESYNNGTEIYLHNSANAKAIAYVNIDVSDYNLIRAILGRTMLTGFILGAADASPENTSGTADWNLTAYNQYAGGAGANDIPNNLNCDISSVNGTKCVGIGRASQYENKSTFTEWWLE